ncbi:MAG: helix-turn-helix domain-containing protein [Coriobacteriales bacterium]|jgi:transcriptional regulator with XRE-family HTH domain
MSSDLEEFQDPRGKRKHPRLKDAYKARGLKQKQFAEKMGRNPSTVSAWINGNSYMDDADLVKAASVLHCSVLYLLGIADLPRPYKGYSSADNSGIETSLKLALQFRRVLLENQNEAVPSEDSAANEAPEMTEDYKDLITVANETKMDLRDLRHTFSVAASETLNTDDEDTIINLVWRIDKLAEIPDRDFDVFLFRLKHGLL